jgi:hypothetical protein
MVDNETGVITSFSSPLVGLRLGEWRFCVSGVTQLLAKSVKRRPPFAMERLAC